MVARLTHTVSNAPGLISLPKPRVTGGTCMSAAKETSAVTENARKGRGGAAPLRLRAHGLRVFRV